MNFWGKLYCWKQLHYSMHFILCHKYDQHGDLANFQDVSDNRSS
jgi:hypothetical protein